MRVGVLFFGPATGADQKTSPKNKGWKLNFIESSDNFHDFKENSNCEVIKPNIDGRIVI